MNNKAALFVDINNLYYCVGKRYNGRKIDYKLYLERANVYATVTRAFCYGFQVDKEAVNFITCLRKIGYDPKYKAPRMIGENFKRMDWNVGLCIDVVRMIDRSDAVIIGSSDPELVPLIQWIKDRGVQSIIFSSLISKELKDISDRYYEISEDVLEKLPEEEESVKK
jgi:uncharacterized LabA/DUF88 family protein